MKTYYTVLLETIPFRAEAAAYLCEIGKRVLDTQYTAVETAVNAYIGGSLGIEEAAASLHPSANALGISARTMDFVFVACASYHLREKFRQDGIADEVFWDTIADLCCKVEESYTVYGEWGIDCLLWYDIFFKGNLFWLGRLQYERRTLPSDTPVTVGGYTVQPNDTVYSVHIPSSGPLTREARMDSYRRAYTFFKEELGGKPMVCCCLSWLLFPANREIFPPHLNLIDFMGDFKIVDQQPNNFRDLWRVFGMPYTGDLSVLPRDNTMRRAFGEWLDNGGQPGYGVGYFVFDGEHILND